MHTLLFPFKILPTDILKLEKIIFKAVRQKIFWQNQFDLRSYVIAIIIIIIITTMNQPYTWPN